MGGRPFSPQ